MGIFIVLGLVMGGAVLAAEAQEPLLGQNIYLIENGETDPPVIPPIVPAPPIEETEPPGEPTVPPGEQPAPPESPTPSEPPPADDPVESPNEEVVPSEDTVPADPVPRVFEQIPPASSVVSTSWISWVIAAGVLLASAVLLFVLHTKRFSRYLARSREDVTPEDTHWIAPKAETFAAVEAVGEAMIDAGYSVVSVQNALEDIAKVNGHQTTEVVVFPTALIVSARDGGEVSTGAVSSGRSKLLLHQVDALDTLVWDARTGLLTPQEVTRTLYDLRRAPSPYPIALRVAAYSLLSAGLAVLLGASWLGVGLAALFGVFVGSVLQLTAKSPRRYEPLVTVGLAFAVSASVFTLVGAGLDPGVLPSLIAPLVILLPGGLLTMAVIELATGQMMSGAGRLAAGCMQLILLAVGIVAGAMLIGVPQIEFSEAYAPIGAIGPWIAVAAFGVGIVVNQSGRPKSIPWILLVLYVAYGAQVIGDVFFGGVLSAMIGALVMTPVAILVSRHRSGPAAIVSFLPGFWLLVPGALGLVGVTSMISGGGAGSTTLVTTLFTMVAIALGILAGSSVSGPLRASRQTVF